MAHLNNIDLLNYNYVYRIYISTIVIYEDVFTKAVDTCAWRTNNAWFNLRIILNSP